MNVSGAMITMPKEEAAEKLCAYRRDLHKDSDELYREAERGYAELAKGTPLLQLSKAIAQGGYDDKMRPRLAIARADRKEVEMRWESNSETIAFNCYERSLSSWDRRSVGLRQTVGVGRTHGLKMFNANGTGYGVTVIAFALVPMVPADVRPATGQLRDWWILWEVDQWFDRSQTAKASKDPMLLKHIGGDLWAVLAHWDLTPLEMAILEARPR
ncbi:MAG: hypothetical protein QM811_16665 [Pirellulales bacterium]